MQHSMLKFINNKATHFNIRLYSRCYFTQYSCLTTVNHPLTSRTMASKIIQPLDFYVIHTQYCTNYKYIPESIFSFNLLYLHTEKRCNITLYLANIFLANGEKALLLASYFRCCHQRCHLNFIITVIMLQGSYYENVKYV